MQHIYINFLLTIYLFAISRYKTKKKLIYVCCLLLHISTSPSLIYNDLSRKAFILNNNFFSRIHKIQSIIIMRGKLMLKKIIFCVKLSLLPTLCWPLSKDATRLKISCVKLYHYLSIILLTMSLQLSLIYDITIHLNDFIVLIGLIVELSSTTHSIGNFIFHRINKHRIQVIAIYIYLIS